MINEILNCKIVKCSLFGAHGNAEFGAEIVSEWDGFLAGVRIGPRFTPVVTPIANCDQKNEKLEDLACKTT